MTGGRRLRQKASRQGVPSVLPMLLTGNTLIDTPTVGAALDGIIDEASVSGRPPRDGQRLPRHHALMLALSPAVTA